MAKGRGYCDNAAVCSSLAFRPHGRKNLRMRLAVPLWAYYLPDFRAQFCNLIGQNVIPKSRRSTHVLQKSCSVGKKTRTSIIMLLEITNPSVDASTNVQCCLQLSWDDTGMILGCSCIILVCSRQCSVPQSGSSGLQPDSQVTIRVRVRAGAREWCFSFLFFFFWSQTSWCICQT